MQAASYRPSGGKYDVQIDKTSRTTVLFQSNISNTRSATAYLIEILAKLAKKFAEQARLCQSHGNASVSNARAVAGQGCPYPSGLQLLS